MKSATIRNIIILLLLCFSFQFAHSEFDFLTPQSDDHSTHDYCELVKSTTVHHVDIKNVLKPGQSIGHSNYFIPSEVPFISNESESLLERHKIPLLHYKNHTFIVNRTLLI